jgi:hypothetical protein
VLLHQLDVAGREGLGHVDSIEEDIERSSVLKVVHRIEACPHTHVLAHQRRGLLRAGAYPDSNKQPDEYAA